MAVHQKFGSMNGRKLIEACNKISIMNGFEISPYMADMLIKYNQNYQFSMKQKKYFRNNIQILKDEYLIQSDLAKTLSD